MIDPLSGEDIPGHRVPPGDPGWDGVDDADGAARLPPLSSTVLDDAQRLLYEAVTGGSDGREDAPVRRVDREGRLLGPYNAMLYSPRVGLSLQELGEALRSRISLTPREREIAALVVAAHQRADYAWYAHERTGRRAGLTPREIDILREGRAPLLADARERVVYEAARQLAAEGDLADALFTEAATILGRAGLVELVTLVGYCSTLALHLRVFRVGVPAGEPAPRWPDADPG